MSSNQISKTRAKPTVSLARALTRPNKHAPGSRKPEPSAKPSGCKHKSTTVDDDHHIRVCTLCGGVVGEDVTIRTDDPCGERGGHRLPTYLTNPFYKHALAGGTVGEEPSRVGWSRHPLPPLPPKARRQRDTSVVRGPVTLIGGSTGVCTHEFVQGKREGTVCDTSTKNRSERCHDHKPRKNAKPPKVVDTCAHEFVQGKRKGTVCGAPTGRHSERCFRHK